MRAPNLREPGRPPPELREDFFPDRGLTPLRRSDRFQDPAGNPGWEPGAIQSMLWKDLGYACRRLWKQPGFTLVALLALALGIGANTAIFSLLDAVVLKPLPYRQAERIVAVWATSPEQGLPQTEMSFPTLRA